jgi:aminomethyltransferase
MTPFGGWEMPLQYTSVLTEHRACRRHGVVFDVSHLGAVRVHGPGAFSGLQALFTNDLRRIGVGRAQYTHLLDEDDAHVVDDIVVWWVRADDFLVIPNAANTGPALGAMRAALEAAPDGGLVEDVTATRALLAVQGPRAREHLEAVVPDAAAVGHFEVARVAHAGHELLVGGTGYTGEDGVELHVPAAGAVALWRALLGTGLVPAGLGARDTLRLEMGYPLHGHELGPGVTPLQAGLGWVVGWDKGPFRGRAALEAERARGVHRRLRGVLVDGRQVPRQGCGVFAEGSRAGEVTSGNFSPTLERGIGLAFVRPDLPPGAPVEVEIRGRRVPATVVAPPFVSPSPADVPLPEAPLPEAPLPEAEETGA